MRATAGSRGRRGRRRAALGRPTVAAQTRTSIGDSCVNVVTRQNMVSSRSQGGPSRFRRGTAARCSPRGRPHARWLCFALRAPHSCCLGVGACAVLAAAAAELERALARRSRDDAHADRVDRVASHGPILRDRAAVEGHFGMIEPAARFSEAWTREEQNGPRWCECASPPSRQVSALLLNFGGAAVGARGRRARRRVAGSASAAATGASGPTLG